MAGRIRVHKGDQRMVLAVGAITGVGLGARGLSPTGQAAIDWILLIASATAVVWAAATAPWWALVVLAAVAAAVAPPWGALLVGLGLVGLALAVGVMKRSQPLERSAVAGASLLLLSLGRELGAWGVNAAVAVGVSILVALLGARRRPGPERRLAWWVGGAAAGVVVLGGAGLGLAGFGARDDLTSGNDTARQGLRLLERGDFAEARDLFGTAAGRFESAASALDAPWAQVSRLVPVAAQHRTAGSDLSWGAADASRTIEEQLRAIDLDSLRIVDGRIDVEAVRSLQAPMATLQAALDELDVTVAGADNGWLAGPLRDRLHDLTAEIGEQRSLSQHADQWLAVAPQLLGADAPRTYFVMFTTPAEVRGQGGFMGNWAELTIDNGDIEMTAFGRHSDLNRAVRHPLRLGDGVPDDWYGRYATYEFAEGPELVVGNRPWTLIGLSPNFPSTAQVVADLYPKSGGKQLDGVFALDVFALQRLIGLVGPVEVEGVPSLTGENAADYLMREQYTRLGVDYDNPERIDDLELFAHATVERLLSINPPDPLDLGKAMRPLAEERRLTAWLRDPAEEALVRSIDLDGTVLDADARAATGDGVAVTVNNESGSKINAYVDHAYSYDSATGNFTATFTNTAPATGLPSYVIGAQGTGDPDGTAAMRVSLFSTRAVDAISVDGAEAPMRTNSEAGLQVYDVTVKVASGATSSVTFHFEDPPPAALTIEPQPFARPAQSYTNLVLP